MKRLVYVVVLFVLGCGDEKAGGDALTDTLQDTLEVLDTVTEDSLDASGDTDSPADTEDSTPDDVGHDTGHDPVDEDPLPDQVDTPVDPVEEEAVDVTEEELPTCHTPHLPDLSILDGTTGFSFQGRNSYDDVGRDVSYLGDVNADGYDDLGISAPEGGTEGHVYVVFGGPATGRYGYLDRYALDGIEGFTMVGIGPSSETGTSLAGDCDVNNDTIEDILVGIGEAGITYGRSEAGGAAVVFGAAGLGATGTLDLGTVDGTNGVVMLGSVWQRAGVDIDCAGDVDNDGFDDIIVGGARSGSFNVNSASLVYGGSSIGTAGFLDLDLLDGSDGVKIEGEEEGDGFGHPVAGLGDVNGDGYDDFGIGAGNAIEAVPGSGYGLFYVFEGGPSLGSGGYFSTASFTTSTGFALYNGGGRIGGAISRLGDVNGDTLADYLVADSLDSSTGYLSGVAFVVYGRATTPSLFVDLSMLDPAVCHRFATALARDSFGRAVASAGDVDLDTIPDVLVSGRGTGSMATYGTGKVYLVDTTPPLLHDPTLIDGTHGSIFEGLVDGDALGWCIATAGDTNADTVADIVMGAPVADSSWGTDAGEAYVIFSRSVCTPGGAVTAANPAWQIPIGFKADKHAPWPAADEPSGADPEPSGKEKKKPAKSDSAVDSK